MAQASGLKPSPQRPHQIDLRSHPYSLNTHRTIVNFSCSAPLSFAPLSSFKPTLTEHETPKENGKVHQ